MKTHHALTLCLAACCAQAAHAQAAPAGPKLEPGLWEISTVYVSSQSGRAEAALQRMQAQVEALSRMPPEQRKSIEDAMAEQGMQLGDSPNTVKVCIGRDDAARGGIPRPDRNCAQQVLERSARAAKVKFSCPATRPPGDEPPPDSQKETLLEIDFQSKSSYSSHSVMDVTQPGQPTERTIVDQSGRLLGPDCGRIRARGMAATGLF